VTPQAHVVTPLAARQRDVLRLIARYTEATGEPPSASYLGRRLGISHQAVQDHLDALHAKGWITSRTPAGLRCPHVP
jgi:predicted ArsR family transcriptional regulator